MARFTGNFVTDQFFLSYSPSKEFQLRCVKTEDLRKGVDMKDVATHWPKQVVVLINDIQIRVDNGKPIRIRHLLRPGDNTFSIIASDSVSSLEICLRETYQLVYK